MPTDDLLPFAVVGKKQRLAEGPTCAFWSLELNTLREATACEFFTLTSNNNKQQANTVVTGH